MTTAFLTPPLRRVVAMLLACAALVAGGIAGADHVRAVAQTETQIVKDLLTSRLESIDKRLERIERKLDRE